MKKKKGFLAFFLCICMLLCAGCLDGGPSLGGDDDSFGQVLSMEGAKVLSKPTDYDFAGAVGNNSVNYYNEFAREILYGLYNIFENPDAVSFTEQQQKDFFNSLDETNGETFGDFTGEKENDKYYLYDSLRYTIKKVENSDNDGFAVKLTLDASKPWKWTIPYNETENKIIFMTGGLADNSPNYSRLEDIVLEFNDDFENSWTNIYTSLETSGAKVPSFPDFYYKGDLKGEASASYFTSPYYQQSVKKLETIDAKNFFQDALEYATYMFVLGYDYVDYVDTDGQTKNDAPFFDFDVVTDRSTGEVTNVTVGGWENERISVSLQENGKESALGRAKKLYQELGGYVGLTSFEDGEKEGNVQQIERFIKDKVIGADAWGTGDQEGGKFEVKIFENGTAKDSLFFNRNYEQIVKNVVNYACTKAPIGGTGDATLDLNKPYLASDITDFKGNYFEPYTSGETGDEFDDEDMFHYIDAAEYQSIIFMPTEDELKTDDPLFLSDIALFFEYWDDSSKTYAETKVDEHGRKHAQSITINVGFRYYDHDAGAYTANAVVQKTFDFGKFPQYEDYGQDDYGDAYESHVVYFSDSSTADATPFDSENDGKELQIKTKFTCPTAIDAFANGKVIDNSDGQASRMRIGGGSAAKDYYKLNKSSTYGFFGSLDPETFAKNGDQPCDFIEVYFDVVKQKVEPGADEAFVDYSFKVCAQFLTINESQKNQY